jgi:hypothetical protein
VDGISRVQPERTDHGRGRWRCGDRGYSGRDDLVARALGRYTNRGIASVAFGSAFFAVALAAVVGELQGRRWIVAAAGCALVGMILVTRSPGLAPLVIPAAFLVWRGFDDPAKWPRTAGLAAAVDAGFGVGAVLALVLHADPAEWMANGIHHGSSDIITRTEALISLVLSAMMVLAACFAPSRHRRT